MREFTLVFDEGLQKGLRNKPRTGRKEQWLIEALGMIPEDNIMQSIPQLPAPTKITGSTYPYPQIFKLRNLILVCDERTIYSYSSGTLTLEYHSATGGGTWTVADFGDYVVLTNGSSLVERNPRSGAFESVDDCDIPRCLCVLNLNGQLLVGGPAVSVSEGFTGA